MKILFLIRPHPPDPPDPRSQIPSPRAGEGACVPTRWINFRNQTTSASYPFLPRGNTMNWPFVLRVDATLITSGLVFGVKLVENVAGFVGVEFVCLLVEGGGGDALIEWVVEQREQGRDR